MEDGHISLSVRRRLPRREGQRRLGTDFVAPFDRFDTKNDILSRTTATTDELLPLFADDNRTTPGLTEIRSIDGCIECLADPGVCGRKRNGDPRGDTCCVLVGHSGETCPVEKCLFTGSSDDTGVWNCDSLNRRLTCCH